MVRTGPQVVVVGAGAFGGWTALHLSRRGARVTLLDAVGPGHDRASSGGLSRVLRHAYTEPIYVEMAARARRQWETAQENWGVELFTVTGLALMWAGAGTQERRAAPLARGDILPLTLEGGDRLDADAVVFACGSWLGGLLPEVGSRVRPTRQAVLFFHVPGPEHRLGSLPVWAERGERFWYGVPAGDLHPFKVADDTPGPAFDPDGPAAEASAGEIARARAYLDRRFPALARAPLAGSRLCPYELTGDRGLILDRHPGEPRAWLAGGGSGHGFKHAPVVGEIMAAAVLGQADPPADWALARWPGNRRQD